MECPRCGGAVTVYRLGDQESYVCADCEYVGIDVEHGAEPEEIESWDVALDRFYERSAGAADAGAGIAADGEPGAGGTDADGSPADGTGDVEADGTAEGSAVDAGGSGDDGAGDELTPAIVRVDADAGGS